LEEYQLRVLELQESLQAAELLNQNITTEYNRLLQSETVRDPLPNPTQTIESMYAY